MAKHDIVLLNTTSSGFETDLGNNTARIKGDSTTVFSVRDSSGVNKFSVNTTNSSVTFASNITSSGHVTSSINSTASFGRIDVTNLTGDASLMTNTNQIGHVSSSKQLAARISGAFNAGFTTTGDISGSATSTGSFGLVFADVYSGDASQMTNVPITTNTLSSSAQIASRISGSFTSGFELTSGNISGSAISTGSFGRVVFNDSITTTDASEVINFVQNTGGKQFVSSSAQIASYISGSFNKGFEFTSGNISGSATSTGSFSRIDFIGTGLSGDASQMTNVPIDTGTLSGSAQIASRISGSFNKGFGFEGQISGSATSTGSFGKLTSTIYDLTTVDVTGSALQRLTGIISQSGQIASRISGSHTSGFEFTSGNISGSATSTGSFSRIEATKFIGDGAAIDVSSAFSSILTGSSQIASYISGSHTHGFNFSGTIQGGAYSSTGTWSAGGNLNTARSYLGGTGTKAAALAVGGGSSCTHTEEYNGTSWSEVNNLNAGRGMLVGTGTTEAAVFYGGGPSKTDATEEWNGTNWSEVNDLIKARFSHMKLGITSEAALAVGGNTTEGGNEDSDVEDWNGTNWSAGTALLANAGYVSSFGTYDSGIVTSYTEYYCWNGTNWSDEGNLIVTGRYYDAGGGSSNDGWIAGGYAGSLTPNISAIVEYYNGTSWSTGTFLITNRQKAGSADSLNTGAPSAMVFGGDNPSALNSAEEFTTGEFPISASFGKFTSEQYAGDAAAVAGMTGLTEPQGALSSSKQIADQVSGSFQHGFRFTGQISGSATSTGSFGRVNVDQIHANRFYKLKIDSAGNTLRYNAHDLANEISGAFDHGFSLNNGNTISGSVTSTGSFGKIVASMIEATSMTTGPRKPISGSMNHIQYLSGSFITRRSTKPFKIPVFGRGHTVNTQQFTATGSMESQKYRTRAGQLFVDNFGRLNITRQTGSLVTQPEAWEAGPTTILTDAGGAATAGTRDAFIMAAPFTPAHINSGSAMYDGISWTRVSDATAGHGSQLSNCSIGSVDAALFLNASGGIGNGTNTGRYGSFPYTGAHTTYMELWDGVGYYRGPGNTGTYVKRNGAGGKVGSVNSHIVFNGSDYLAPTYPTAPGTADWNGVTWQEAGAGTPTRRNYGGGFGGVNDGVYAGGGSPNDTCVDEWNGTTWASATALPTGQSKGGGFGNQNAGGIFAGNPAKKVQIYNGTAWSEGPNTPINMSNPSTQGTGGRAHNVQTNCTLFWTGAFVTGSSVSAATRAGGYNNFTQNPTGKYLLTKRIEASLSPSHVQTAGVTSGSSTSNEGITGGSGYGGGY